jgi:hypothetical protein
MNHFPSFPSSGLGTHFGGMLRVPGGGVRGSAFRLTGEPRDARDSAWPAVAGLFEAGSDPPLRGGSELKQLLYLSQRPEVDVVLAAAAHFLI